MTPDRPLTVERKETLVESIAQGLIRYIAANGLQEGDRLPSERELMEMAGVSRLPLREALSLLQGLGVIEARHGKGRFLRALDVGALFAMLSPILRTQSDIGIAHIVEVRRHLEPTIAFLAAANRTEANLVRLRMFIANMEANVPDVPACSRCDLDFHQELARATGNPIFRVFMASVTDLMNEVQLLYAGHDGSPETVIRASIDHHGKVLRAVEAHDGVMAREAMQNHIEAVESRLLGGVRAGV